MVFPEGWSSQLLLALTHSPELLFSSHPWFVRPTIGGKYCLGERKRYRSCNTDVSTVRIAERSSGG